MIDLKNVMYVTTVMHHIAHSMRERNPNVSVAKMHEVLVQMGFNANTVSTQISTAYRLPKLPKLLHKLSGYPFPKGIAP